jgi:hypothetical protein
MERVGHDMHLSYCSRGPTAPLIIIMREKINMLSGLGRRKLPRREGRRGPLPATLQRQNTEISKQIFPEKEYRGLSPNVHIHASVSDLYIPTISLPILLEELCRSILGLYKSLTDT